MPKLFLVQICRKTREQRHGGSCVLLMTTRDIILTCSENRRLFAPLFKFSANGFLVTSVDIKNNSNCPGQAYFISQLS